MRHLAAYLLLTVGGNDSPSEADIEKVLSSVGIEADGDRIKALLKEVKGKDLQELIATGAQKMASMPSAAAGAGPVAAAAAAGAAAGVAAAEEKKEEKEEQKEESDEDMGFGLFD